MRWFVKPRAAMFQYFAIATAIIAVCNAADNNLIERVDGDLVHVDVYYTSLCTDAKWFINNQFVPTYETLGEYMTVSYIPWGRTQYELVTSEDGTQGWSFTCQFGVVDCHGNKEHACAINEILTNPEIANEQQLLANFIECTMANDNPALAVPQCLLTIGITATDVLSVINCATSTEGEELFVAHGNTTQAMQPPLNFVPTIIINQVFSQENQDNSFVDFGGVICNNIPAESQPTICSDSTSLHYTKNIANIIILLLVSCSALKY